MVTLYSDSTSSRNASNSSSARSTSSTSSTLGVVSSACSSGRATRNAAAVQLGLQRRRVRLAVGGLGRAQVQDLPREVPVVQRLGGVDALVALQPDQRGVQDRGDGAGQGGLAHPGVPLEEQGSVQPQREEHRRGQPAVGEVVRTGEPGRHPVGIDDPVRQQARPVGGGHAQLGPGRRLQRPAGQDPRQVLAELRVGVEVAGRFGPVGRGLGRLRDACRATPPRAPARWPSRARAPCPCGSARPGPPRSVPLERCTSAHDPTMAHACATRLNFW